MWKPQIIAFISRHSYVSWIRCWLMSSVLRWWCIDPIYRPSVPLLWHVIYGMFVCGTPWVIALEFINVVHTLRLLNCMWMYVAPMITIDHSKHDAGTFIPQFTRTRYGLNWKARYAIRDIVRFNSFGASINHKLLKLTLPSDSKWMAHTRGAWILHFIYTC